MIVLLLWYFYWTYDLKTHFVENIFKWSWAHFSALLNGFKYCSVEITIKPQWFVYTLLKRYTWCLQTSFVQAFKIVVDSWKFSMLLLYMLWDDWPIFMISSSKEQLQQQLEYTLRKIDCHSEWISKMQSGREYTLEERFAIEFSFKLGKKATETYRILQTVFRPSCMNRASVLSGIRDLRKAGRLWGIMRGVGGVRKSIHQCWLAKGLGLWLLCWGFKGVQQEIPPEEASTLQIGSVAFPPGQCRHSTTPSLSQTIWPRWASRQFPALPTVQTLLLVTFVYSLSSEAVVMR